MFGVRLSSLFTSRWMALAWAGLMCLTAIEFAGEQGKTDDAVAPNAETAAETAQAVNTAMAAMH